MNISNVTQDFKLFSKLLSDKSLSKKASLNVMTMALDHGSRLIVSFIITPLLVSGLGEFFYGVWQVLKQLVGQISPASGRATQALKWTIARQQASSDFEKKRRHIGSPLVVWLLLLLQKRMERWLVL